MEWLLKKSSQSVKTLFLKITNCFPVVNKYGPGKLASVHVDYDGIYARLSFGVCDTHFQVMKRPECFSAGAEMVSECQYCVNVK